MTIHQFDLVTWTRDGQQYSGIVQSAAPRFGYVWVLTEDNATYFVNTSRLTRVGDDEQNDLLAVHPSPFEVLVDDYWQLLQMGDLGGVELV